jgi:hypothetical protein
VRVEQRAQGTLVVQSSASLRWVMLALALSIAATPLFSETGDLLKTVLCWLGALIPLVFAAFGEQSRFEFDAPLQRLRWTRRNWVRTRSGALHFSQIRAVRVVSRTDSTDDPPRSVYAVLLQTDGGPLPLGNLWWSAEAPQTRVAQAICVVLGLPPPPLAGTADSAELSRGREKLLHLLRDRSADLAAGTGSRR